MRPDHDKFNGSVNLDDAGSVRRGIVSPIPAGLRRIPDRTTGDQANRIFCQVPKFPRLPGLVPARPQPSVAGLTVDRGTGLNFALVPYHRAEQARGTT